VRERKGGNNLGEGKEGNDRNYARERKGMKRML